MKKEYSFKETIVDIIGFMIGAVAYLVCFGTVCRLSKAIKSFMNEKSKDDL
jgi:hypothetical protein